MDRDSLYFHFANMALVLIGLLSILRIGGWVLFLVLMPGVIAGFMFSLKIKTKRPQHLDTFIGMLSLASIVILFGRLYEVAITFDNILKIFATALMWLCVFQSFGLNTGKSYAILQFISVSLLIASVSLALEEPTVYAVYLAVFLFILIFTMRLGLLCDRKTKGSLIVGDQAEIMSLWQQIKIGSLMFSFVLIIASLVYPFVPRFENISLKNIPSTLLGMGDIPLLRLIITAKTTIKENKNVKKEALVDERIRKRENDDKDVKSDEIYKEEPIEDTKEREINVRFPTGEFNKDIDIFKIESLTIRVDAREVPLGSQTKLMAELKMSDGSIIAASRLVDWQVSGDAKVFIDKDAKLIPKEHGSIQVSASYMGTFSNDLSIKIIEPVHSKKKKGVLFYLLIIFWGVLILALIGALGFILERAKHLKELSIDNPREFIKEIYNTLSRAFRAYGIMRFDYIAHREFAGLVKEVISSRPEPMHLLTEKVLEARFSTHEISFQYSQEAIMLFHEIKDTLFEKSNEIGLWRRILLRLYVLDVLLIGS